jgi:predicted dienelactone hydrolase
MVLAVFATSSCGTAEPTTTPTSSGGAANAIGDAASGNDELPVDGGVQPPSADAHTGATNYGEDGPVAFKPRVEHVTSGGKSFDVTIYMPETTGKHPLVSFSPGNTQAVTPYLLHARRLASHGIAVILRDDPGTFTPTSSIVTDLVYTVGTWVPAKLANEVDTSRIGLAGHSRGGAVSLVAAEDGLAGKVVAWMGLDPVDNQFAVNPGVYARTKLGQLAIPTAYIGASVESNCAPAADSYPMLFPKTPKPSVLVVGLGAGHTHLADTSNCTACGICSPSGTADAKVVLAYTLRYMTAFFARELLGDTNVGPAFEGAGIAADVAAARVTVTSK